MLLPVPDVDAEPARVAILTDPGGPVLRAATAGCAACRVGRCDPHRPRRAGAAPRRPSCSPTGPGCDPHRPRRAGAALSAHGGFGPVRSGCDPHRPRRAGAARWRGRRSGPIRGGCDPHRPRRAGAALGSSVHHALGAFVAILTDPGGPVLPPPERRPRRSCARCDPHRPRRAGAALGPRQVGTGTAVAILTDPGGPVLPAVRRRPCMVRYRLRSSPTPEGRCCMRDLTFRAVSSSCDPHRPRRAGAAVLVQLGSGGQRLVAILTDPGGPVLPSSSSSVPAGSVSLRSSPTPEGRCCRHHQGWRLLADDVAILTDPGGPVLHGIAVPCAGPARCDPHRPRRAGAARRVAGRPSSYVPLRSSPTPEGRCCSDDAGRLRGTAVAILTDPGGPVLHPPLPQVARGQELRSSPTPEGRCCREYRRDVHVDSSCCDPHRPRRAGAALLIIMPAKNSWWLRSSPTPEGRCCPTPARPVRRTGQVAILTDPGGPVLLSRPGDIAKVVLLRSSPTPEGRCCPGETLHGGRPLTVAILTDPGGPVLRQHGRAGTA